jgi:hypothetical protein
MPISYIIASTYAQQYRSDGAPMVLAMNFVNRVLQMDTHVTWRSWIAKESNKILRHHNKISSMELNRSYTFAAS